MLSYEMLYNVNITCHILHETQCIVCLQVCACLVAPQPYSPSPVEDFDFHADMDWTGGGLLW